MNVKLFFVALFTSFMALGAVAKAQILTLPTLSPTDTDPVFRTLAADLVFTPVQPATDMGLWGLSIGVTGTSTDSSAVHYLTGSSSNIYNANISGTLQLPFGLAIEAGFLPGFSLQSTTMNEVGFDVKWTITHDFLQDLPVDLALRGMITNASLNYSQNVGGSPATINYTANMSGATLSLSKNLIILNPYIGYGFANQSSSLSSTNSALFGAGFPGGTTSASGTGTTGWFQLGAQLKLAFLTLAGEYDNLFSVSTFSARVAFAL